MDHRDSGRPSLKTIILFKKGKEFTIDELARASETTVRNIRAYQDRGLLPPPELRGRKGYYFNSHLARLRVISGLLDRGYSLNSIKDLIDALENGIDLRHLMGLESASLDQLKLKFGEIEFIDIARSKIGGKIS